jgi:cell division protein FtsB
MTVTDKTQSATPQTKARSPMFPAENRFLTALAGITTVIGILIGGYLYGQFLSARDLGGRDAVIEELRTENQKLKRSIDEKQAQLTTLQGMQDAARAALEAIMPAANTYNIIPNQTLIVADGHLTVGMIGSPANEGVMLSINGKQQTVTAGQIVTVAPDASTHCQLSLQSFDMFKATINASCPGAKAQ